MVDSLQIYKINWVIYLISVLTNNDIRKEDD